MRSHFLVIVTCVYWLTACTNSPTPVMYNCPQLQLPPDPNIPVHSLNDKSTPDIVIKSWVATATAYRDWNRIVRNQVDSSH